MASVSSGTEISLASISDPHVTLPGVLVSFEGRYANVSLNQATPLHQGSLVQFQTSQTLYLGEIESGWTEEGFQRLRILIEHSVDLERAAAIRRLWNTDNPI
jgi:hypothetical protein